MTDPFKAVNAIQAMQPIHTGLDGLPPSNITQIAVATGGVVVEPKSRHGIAQSVPAPGTDGTLTSTRPFIAGSAVFIAVPR
jgi:hypothetical protein